ncbi:MAG: hypothetical protein ACREN7_07840 [Candidatus Dormibacteria bacterium]
MVTDPAPAELVAGGLGAAERIGSVPVVAGLGRVGTEGCVTDEGHVRAQSASGGVASGEVEPIGRGATVGGPVIGPLVRNAGCDTLDWAGGSTGT